MSEIEWKPIKTAPKTGTFLIYDEFYGGVHMACKESWGWTAADSQKDDISPILWADVPYPSKELIDANSSDEEEEQ